MPKMWSKKNEWIFRMAKQRKRWNKKVDMGRRWNFDNFEFFWDGGGFWSSPEDCWMETGGKTTEEWNSKAFFLCKKCHHFSKSFLDFIKDNNKSKYSENKKKSQQINQLFPRYKNFNNDNNSISGNNMISISITSANQKIQNYKRTYKDTEVFCNIEKELYEVYPEFKELETFFIVGGNKIKRFKTLKENNISNGDIIVLIIFDEDN